MMQEKTIYLDNAAATRLDEKVLEAMKPCFFDDYAAPASEFGYSQGIAAREALDGARARLAASLGAKPEEFIFTSGSTESNNLALKGVSKVLSIKKGNHLIVSKIEDFSVLHSARDLERKGLNVDYLDVDESGLVRINQLKALLSDQTILVSIQHGNQEIGTIQEIETISRLCKARGVLFHTDATYTFTRVPLDVRKIPVDLVTVSAHTIHGPKGVGGLYIRQGTPIAKIMDGGFQEFDLRAGSENIPGAVGFTKAVELVTEDENKRLAEMRDWMIKAVLEKIPQATLNGHPEKRMPYNVNITFHGVEGESVALHLDMFGIAVGTGSASFSRSLKASHVITAIGGGPERAQGSICLTLGRYNSMAEMNYVVDTLTKIVEDQRRIGPSGKKGGV